MRCVFLAIVIPGANMYIFESRIAGVKNITTLEAE
jgi:hypothetical protein